MGTMGKVTVDLEARSAGWTKGLNNAGYDVKAFVRNAERDFKNLTGQGNLSGFAGAWSKHIKGASEFITEIRTGGTASEQFGHIIERLPIAGPFYQAGLAIKEMITGEQAMVIEAKKIGDEADRLSKIYRQIAMDRELRGTRGDERDHKLIERETNARQQSLNDQKKKLEEERDAILAKPEHLRFEGGLTGYAPRYDKEGHYTAEQLERLEAIRKEEQGIRDLRQNANAEGSRSEGKLTKQINQRELEYHREKFESDKQHEEGMTEIALRRSGKRLEATLYSIKAEADARARVNLYSLDDSKIGGLSASNKISHFFAESGSAINTFAKAAQASGILIHEQQFKESELQKDHEEEVTKITAEANIERLGMMGKTHEAEAAKIEENYRASKVAMEKKQREENRLMDTNKSDPTLMAAESAAAMRRFNSLGNEAFKTRQDHIKKERELWASVGDPLQKYDAKLGEINDQFKELGDKKLRDKQLGKLQGETLKEMGFTDHPSGIDAAMHQQRLDYTLPAGATNGNAPIEEMLKILRERAAKQERVDQDVNQLRNVLTKYFEGVITEYNLTGFGAAVGSL
jgi:hypothetical protein